MKKDIYEDCKASLQELKNLSKKMFVKKGYMPILIPELAKIEEEQYLKRLYKKEVEGFIPTSPDSFEAYEEDYLNTCRR